MEQEKSGYVYILASGRNGTLYVGVTSDLIKRMYEHKNKLAEGFSKKYGVDKLIYYEVFSDIKEAIAREKTLKRFTRKAKIELFQWLNPEWIDLYNGLIKQ